jgi:hypothetical protein
MSVTPGYVAWKLAFELSPIVLSGGVLSSFPGQMLPIMAITEALNLPLGLLSSPVGLNLDNTFANWIPLPGTTILEQEIGRYPFANRAIAANATIQMPLHISMLMICTAKNGLAMESKLATMMALQMVLDSHNKAGGTYIVATPSFIYLNCILKGVRDASVGTTKQLQNAWQFDFEKPLLTIDDAKAAQNGLFSLISSGAQVPGGSTAAWSGAGTGATTVSSLAGIPAVPTQVPAVAGNVAGSAGPTGIGV